MIFVVTLGTPARPAVGDLEGSAASRGRGVVAVAGAVNWPRPRQRDKQQVMAVSGSRDEDQRPSRRRVSALAADPAGREVHPAWLRFGRCGSSVQPAGEPQGTGQPRRHGRWVTREPVPGGVSGVADSQHPKVARKTHVGQCSAQQLLGSFPWGQSGTTRSSISIHP